MNKDSNPVDAEDFIGKELSDSDVHALLVQYKLFVGTSESLTSRRQNVNTFFSLGKLYFPYCCWFTLA